MLFLPACLICSYLFPDTLTVFAITYILVTGCISYPVSFVKCPRCRQNFNTFHPLDRENSSVNDGGVSGMANCIYCGSPFKKRKRDRLHKTYKKDIRFSFQGILLRFPKDVRFLGCSTQRRADSVAGRQPFMCSECSGSF